MELPIFDQVGELVRAMAADEHGPMHYRAHRGGVKVWFGSATPPREHYEAQFIPRALADGGEGPAVEVGFHAEHRDIAANDRAMQQLLGHEKTWRKALGPPPVAGGFLGRPDDWRRVSEVWVDVLVDDPDLAFEMAGRLVDYIDALEPLR